MSERIPTWRDELNIVADLVSAETFREELPHLRESYGDDPDVVGAIYNRTLVELFAESAGLFALKLDLEDVPAALAEIREALAGLDFEAERERLEGDERRYYEHFARDAERDLAEAGAGMEALLGCYASGDYDPQANPNDLIASALEMAREDEEAVEQAEQLITQAGATALHGRSVWWRWEWEAHGPAEPWLATILGLVRRYTNDGRTPLGTLEDHRAHLLASEEKVRRKMQQALEEAEEAPAEEAQEITTPEPSSVDEAIDEVIEVLLEHGEAPITADLLEHFEADREVFVPALMDVATDDYLQMMEAPGEGYIPITAVKLLGELKAAEAAPALIDIVAEVDPLAIIYSSAINTLEDMGPLALEPLLDFSRYSQDTEAKTALADALAAAGRDDERAYEAMLDLWEEATWDEGKSLVAYPLAKLGGERAIPPLEAALEGSDVAWMDYNEVAGALEELAVDVSREGAPPSPFQLMSFDRSALLEVDDPARVMSAVEDAPMDWRDHPDGLAHAYTSGQLDRTIKLIALGILPLSKEEAISSVEVLLKDTEALAFDAPVRDYPDWFQQAYDHLAECAGPGFRQKIKGVLLSLQYYFLDEYDADDEPDRLLKTAREQLPDEETAEALFGRASTLILRGDSFWHRWPDETDPPLSRWVEGVIAFRDFLEHVGHIPLKLSEDIRHDVVTSLFEEAEEEKEDLPAEVAELLDVIFAQRDGELPLRQRRRFTHRRDLVTPHLIRLVEEERYRRQDSPGEGWAPIIAARLLGELKAVQAADALVDVVADTPRDAVIHGSAVFSLMHIGRLARPAVQTYFRYGRDIEAKTALAEVLGSVGRRNSEDFHFLQETWEAADWEDHRRMVAIGFGDLQDRRAIPLLQAATGDPSADAMDLEYVRWALQRLGAPTPPRSRRSTRLNTPRPFNPRLIYDEYDRAQRLKYTVWGKPLCPDCGKPMDQDEEGALIHP